jgi:hypothetical protein
LMSLAKSSRLKSDTRTNDNNLLMLMW